MRSRILIFGIMFAVFFFASLTFSGVPQMINYQGKLTDPQGALVDTTIQMVFTIYDAATDGGVLWTETQPSVVVEKGIFSVLLGSVNPIPDPVFTGATRYLGVKVGADPEMTPRKKIVSVGYAYKSEYADTAAYARLSPIWPDGDWFIFGDDIYRETGKVGIGIWVGTTKPNEKLTVAGALSLGEMSAPSPTSSYGKIYVKSTDSKVYFKNDAGTEYDLTAAGIDCPDCDGRFVNEVDLDHLDAADGSPTNAVYADAAGNVGIGTISPINKLTVNGTIRQEGKSSDGNPGIHVGDSAVRLFQTDEGNKSLGIITNSTEKVRILGNGNVGIGTMSPAQKLHVAGTAQMTGFKMPAGASNGYVLTSDGSGVGTWQTAPGGIGGSGTANYIPKFLGSTTLGNSVMYETGGNVGIGTASPNYPLHVSGDAQITGNVGVGNATPNSDRAIYIFKHNSGNVGSKYGMESDIYIGLASGTNYLYGVRGYARSDSWFGTQNLYGVYGHAHTYSNEGGSPTNNAYGVFAKAEATTSGTQKAYGLYATASGGDENWAGYFDAGNVYVGNNIGIGDATPDEKFDVNGDAAVYGGLCVDDADDCTAPADGHVEADAFDYSIAQTRYYSVSHTDVVRQRETTDGTVYTDYVNAEADNTWWFAPVHLPDGAVVTKVVLYGSDSTIGWELYASSISSSSRTEMASANYNSEDTSISNSEIENNAYDYFFGLKLDSYDKFYGGRITYEITTPLP